MKKTGLIVAAVAVALFAGFGAGWIVGQRVTEARVSLDALFTGVAVADRAAVLYYDGNDAAAFEALNRYLQFLDGVDRQRARGTTNVWLDERGTAFERMLTCARLAMLEERRSAAEPTRSMDYWQQAERWAVPAGIKDPSRERIRSIVDRLDRRTTAGDSPKR
jgi:hypothetical protein